MLTLHPIMMKRETFPVDKIYVPVKRKATLDPKRVEEIAQSILADGQKTPILVREDGARFVLVEGLHRREAARSLGEQTIVGFRVDARKHLFARPRYDDQGCFSFFAARMPWLVASCSHIYAPAFVFPYSLWPV